MNVDLDAIAARGARFAVYYAPPRESGWWQAGCSWLGRDPETGEALDPPSPDALPRKVAELTAAPRRYGWHGTLVAPFHLAKGIMSARLLDEMQRWAASCLPRSISVDVAALGRFVAVRPGNGHDEDYVRTLAESALRMLAPLRAPLSEAERARRSTDSLTARQRILLAEWGYPYVLDEFRFHMTLSDVLDDPHARRAIVERWQQTAASLGPLPVNGAALYVEPAPGKPFVLFQRFRFSPGEQA